MAGEKEKLCAVCKRTIVAGSLCRDCYRRIAEYNGRLVAEPRHILERWIGKEINIIVSAPSSTEELPFVTFGHLLEVHTRGILFKPSVGNKKEVFISWGAIISVNPY